MSFSTTSSLNRFVVSTDGTNQGTLFVQLDGKKKALKAAGLPTTLAGCTPSESRWGKAISIEEAKALLSNSNAKRGFAGHIIVESIAVA